MPPVPSPCHTSRPSTQITALRCQPTLKAWDELQSRAIVDGLPGDIVALALPLDVQKIAEAKLIAADWQVHWLLKPLTPGWVRQACCLASTGTYKLHVCKTGGVVTEWLRTA